MPPPLVTVVIPTYNRADLLLRSLGSVQAQTYENLDILVVDDCSTDDTPAAVAAVAEKDPRVRTIRHEKNLKLNGARNTGVENARGEFVCILDSDDLMRPTKIERQLPPLLEHPNVDGTVCQVQFFENEPGDLTDVWNTFRDPRDPLVRYCYDDIVWAPEAGLWRTEVFRRVIPLPLGQPFHTDVQMSQLLILESREIVTLDEVLADHCDAPIERISNKKHKNPGATIGGIYQLLERRLRESGRLTPETQAGLCSTAIRVAFVAASSGEPEVARERAAAAARLQAHLTKRALLRLMLPGYLKLIGKGRGSGRFEQVFGPLGSRYRHWWRKHSLESESSHSASLLPSSEYRNLCCRDRAPSL